LGTISGDIQSAVGAAVLSDHQIISWSDDGTISLWEPATEGPLVKLEGHTKAVLWATSLPDGRLLSWSADRTLRHWDVAAGACHEILSEDDARTVSSFAGRPWLNAAFSSTVAHNALAVDGRGGPTLCLYARTTVNVPWLSSAS
jgi:WD40 repeat protein